MEDLYDDSKRGAGGPLWQRHTTLDELGEWAQLQGPDGRLGPLDYDQAQEYGGRVLGHHWDALDSGQQWAVYMYTVGGWIFNPVARGVSPEAHLEKLRNENILINAFGASIGGVSDLYKILRDLNGRNQWGFSRARRTLYSLTIRRILMLPVDFEVTPREAALESRMKIEFRHWDWLYSETPSERVNEYLDLRPTRNILAILFGGDFPSLGDYREAMDLLASSFSFRLPHSLTVSRLLDNIRLVVPHTDPRIPRSLEGKNYTDPGFQSMSLAAQGPRNFPGMSLRLLMELDKGQRALYIGNNGRYDDQYELLLPPDQNVRVGRYLREAPGPRRTYHHCRVRPGRR